MLGHNCGRKLGSVYRLWNRNWVGLSIIPYHPALPSLSLAGATRPDKEAFELKSFLEKSRSWMGWEKEKKGDLFWVDGFRDEIRCGYNISGGMERENSFLGGGFIWLWLSFHHFILFFERIGPSFKFSLLRLSQQAVV